MSDIKDKITDAASAAVAGAKDLGHTVAEKAKDLGHTAAEKAQGAVDFVKEKTGLGSGVKEHMNVVGSDGGSVGVVDHLESGAIKLTKNASPDGMHHYIPATWVASVDEHVHLSKTAAEAKAGWKSDATSCANC